MSLLEGGLVYERSEIEGSRPTCCAEPKPLKASTTVSVGSLHLRCSRDDGQRRAISGSGNQAILDYAVSGGGRIHINLIELDPARGGLTAHELQYVCGNPAARAATTFYGGAAPCWSRLSFGDESTQTKHRCCSSPSWRRGSALQITKESKPWILLRTYSPIYVGSRLEKEMASRALP